MKISTSIILFLITIPVCAQNHQLAGRVLSLNNTAIGGVNVILKGTPSGTATDMNGYFGMPVPDGRITLVFSYLNQKPLEYAFTVRQGFQYQVNVQMAGKLQTFHRSHAFAAELPQNTPQINGRILDQGGTPLTGALITQNKNAFIAVSGPDGSFTLPVPKGRNILSFKANGLKPFDYPLEVEEGHGLVIEVSLVEDKPKYRRLDGAAKTYTPPIGKP